jgi:hypothetical protein
LLAASKDKTGQLGDLFRNAEIIFCCSGRLSARIQQDCRGRSLSASPRGVLGRRLAARMRPHFAKIRDCGSDGVGGERSAIVGYQF